MRIVEFTGQSRAWDEFVNGQKDATFFHKSGWREVLMRGFGHRAHYLMAEQDGAVVGVLPLMQLKTLLFGHSLISLPFCVYGGPLAVEADAAHALLEHAIKLQQDCAAPSLEMRFLHMPDAAIFGAHGWQAREGLYATFRKEILGSDDENMKAIPRKQRAMVRKGIDRGLRAEINQDVRRAHGIYAHSVRNLGTPVFSRKYFDLLASAFGDALDVFTIFDGDTAVSAVINFYWRDEVLPYYGGGTDAARGCYANDFMYWSVMRQAAERGARLFDFGRSKEGTGAYSFKKNWGYTPQALRYYFHLLPGKSIPDHNPLNPKYQLMIKTWKRLPLPVANFLGPYLVRGVG